MKTRVVDRERLQRAVNELNKSDLPVTTPEQLLSYAVCRTIMGELTPEDELSDTMRCKT